MNQRNHDRMPMSEKRVPPGVAGRGFSIAPADAEPSAWSVLENGVVGFVESGLMGFRTKDRSTVLTAGMMIYVPPDLPCRIIGLSDECRGWSVRIGREWTGDLPPRPSVVRPTNLLLEFCRRILSWGPEGEGDVASRRRLARAFLDELRAAGPAAPLDIPLPSTPSLIAIARRLLASPTEKRDIDGWAKVAGMSRRTFTDHFAAETGLSFAVWRQTVRLQAAMKKIESGKTVAVAAVECGFASPSAFIRLFRRQFGVTPKQYVLRDGAKTVEGGLR